MNSEIERLLVEAGVPEGFGWRDVMVVQNYRPVPPPIIRTDVWLRNQGFHMVVMSHGAPAFFCKCRMAGDKLLERETSIRSRLGGIRRDGLSVPEARGASSHRLAIQVGPFIPATHHGRIVTRQSSVAYLRMLRTIIEGCAELSRIALARCAELRRPAATILLREAAADSLAYITAALSLDPKLEAAFAAVLGDAGEVTPRPQHGDLWSGNLLVSDGQVWAVDFEQYGLIWVPLYDDLHLVWTTLAARARNAVDRLEWLNAADPDARACRALLVERALAYGLALPQLDGVLVYYLLKMASTVHRDAGPSFGAPFLEDCHQLAQRLAAGKRGLLRAG